MKIIRTHEDLIQTMVPLEKIIDCINEHKRQTGNDPVEISLDKAFVQINGCRINFHDLGPFIVTFDGDKIIQHPSVEN